MKKCSVLICVLTIAVLLTGCENKDNSTDTTFPTNENIDVTEASVTNERYPSFAVDTVSTAKGNKDVVVRVSLENNPGFLTMAMDIGYDSGNMSLTKVMNGSDYSDYYFVGPKNKQSGCTASWFIAELPENVVDGHILELHFAINEQVESGSYPITIMCSDNGDIVDGDKNAIKVNSATGYIKID